MDSRRGLAGMALAALIALGLAGCGPKTVTLSVEMKDFSFTPDKWTVPAGAEVTINARNNGALLHEWAIVKKGETVEAPWDDDADQEKIFWELEDIEAGETKSITFTAPTEPGDYQIVCGQPAHIEQGMVGTLTVTP